MQNSNTLNCKYEISYEVEVLDSIAQEGGGLRKTTKTITETTAEGTLVPILEEIVEVAKGINYDNINMKDVNKTRRSFGRGTFKVEYTLKFNMGWDTKFTIKVSSSPTAYKVLAFKLRELGCTVWQSKIES